jgi:hypothetical protein
VDEKCAAKIVQAFLLRRHTLRLLLQFVGVFQSKLGKNHESMDLPYSHQTAFIDRGF